MRPLPRRDVTARADRTGAPRLRATERRALSGIKDKGLLRALGELLRGSEATQENFQKLEQWFPAGTPLPISTRGDLITGDEDGAATILPLGEAKDGYVLTVDSSAPLGIKWAPASEGEGEGGEVTEGGTKEELEKISAAMSIGDSVVTEPNNNTEVTEIDYDPPSDCQALFLLELLVTGTELTTGNVTLGGNMPDVVKINGWGGENTNVGFALWEEPTSGVIKFTHSKATQALLLPISFTPSVNPFKLPDEYLTEMTGLKSSEPHHSWNFGSPGFALSFTQRKGAGHPAEPASSFKGVRFVNRANPESGGGDADVRWEVHVAVVGAGTFEQRLVYTDETDQTSGSSSRIDMRTMELMEE